MNEGDTRRVDYPMRRIPPAKGPPIVACRIDRIDTIGGID